jgi:hypothetical protein
MRMVLSGQSCRYFVFECYITYMQCTHTTGWRVVDEGSGVGGNVLSRPGELVTCCWKGVAVVVVVVRSLI